MYLFNSPVKPLVARDTTSLQSSIFISPRRCRLSPQKARAIAIERMSRDQRRQEHAFAVSLSEPVFCPSIPAPFAIQAHFFAGDGERRSNSDIVSTNAGGAGAMEADDDDELMSDDTSFNTAPPHFLTRRDTPECLSSISDSINYGFQASRSFADIPQHHPMSLTSVQLQRQYNLQHRASSHPPASHSLASWTQIINGRSQSIHGVPRSSWARADEASLERQFLQNLTLNNDLNSWFGLHASAWTVDHEHRFYDVDHFLLNWADFEESADVLSMRSKYMPSLDPSRNVWTAQHTDMQGIDWEACNVTREDMFAARQRYYPYRDCNPRKKPVDTGAPMYRFKSFRARHRAKCVHYQLRNLVTATSRGQVFYAAGTKVMVANLAVPSMQTTAMDFGRPSSAAMPFRITCLTSAQAYDDTGILVAGGFNGEFAVLNLDSENATPHEGFVSHAYDGLVTHIDAGRHRRTGSPQATFSTNDCQVRTMDLSTLKTTTSLHYSHAVNASCTSADGRLRLLVGDHLDSMITDAERGTPLVHLSGHSKDGFACAWSDNGRIAATGAQDGFVAVWDTRNWSTPLDIVDRVTSCARSLHFTADNRLVIAEDDDVVSIYDATSRHRQNITMFGSIAGVTLLNGGDEIVVANCDANLGGLLVLGRGNDKCCHLSDLVL